MVYQETASASAPHVSTCLAVFILKALLTLFMSIVLHAYHSYKNKIYNIPILVWPINKLA